MIIFVFGVFFVVSWELEDSRVVSNVLFFCCSFVVVGFYINFGNDNVFVVCKVGCNEFLGWGKVFVVCDYLLVILFY